MNEYIKKSHITALARFNDELKAFALECEEKEATLYEDAYTSFTLSDLRVEDGCLCYRYDGVEEREIIVRYDEDENDYYEDEIDGIMEYIKFWRSCLRRAKRYWSMDVETLDAIQNGEIEDNE